MKHMIRNKLYKAKNNLLLLKISFNTWKKIYQALSQLTLKILMISNWLMWQKKIAIKVNITTYWIRIVCLNLLEMKQATIKACLINIYRVWVKKKKASKLQIFITFLSICSGINVPLLLWMDKYILTNLQHKFK